MMQYENPHLVCKKEDSPSSLVSINPLKAELNPICHLLALLGPHHIFHVSRIRVEVFWQVTPSKLISNNQHAEGLSCFHLCQTNVPSERNVPLRSDLHKAGRA